MNDRYKSCILLGIAAAVWLWAAVTCQGAKSGQIYISLEGGAEIALAERIAAETVDPVGCCFWGETENQTYFCPATGRTAQAARVYLAGNGELLGAGALSWRSGCLIDADTAQALFGTEACGAQTLRWNGQEYPVLGTVSALRPTVVMPAQADDSLTRCVLALPPENGRTLGEQFLLRFGLTGTVLDFYSLWALARNLLLLAPMVLLISLYHRAGANCASPQTDPCRVGASIARPQDDSEAFCHSEPAPALAWESHQAARKCPHVHPSPQPPVGLSRRCAPHKDKYFSRDTRPPDPCHCKPVLRPQYRERIGKLLILALGLFLLWKGTVIPPDLIPSRWSDFSFWSGWWETWKENLRSILFTPLGGRQLQILLNMVKSVIGSILAALLVHRAHL